MADIIAFVYVWRGEESCETWDRVVARKCTRLSGSGDPIEYPCYRPGTTSSQTDEGVITTRTKASRKRFDSTICFKYMVLSFIFRYCICHSTGPRPLCTFCGRLLSVARYRSVELWPQDPLVAAVAHGITLRSHVAPPSREMVQLPPEPSIRPSHSTYARFSTSQ